MSETLGSIFAWFVAIGMVMTFLYLLGMADQSLCVGLLLGAMGQMTVEAITKGRLSDGDGDT